MSLIGNAIRSNFRTINQNHGVSFFLRDSVSKRFSTESEPPPPPPPPQDSSVDSFLRPPNTGLVYGKLSSGGRHTMKTDIINLLEGCNLTLDDVKVNYNNMFQPVGIMVQFPSPYAFDNAFRAISRKGGPRLYKLERASRSQWDFLTPYNGRTVLLQGIPRNALSDDVERFLCGCDYDASSIQFQTRPALPESIRMALVYFPSQVQAMNAFVKKNRGFCLNSQILVRVLQ